MNRKEIIDAIRNGCIEKLNIFSKIEPSFPDGICPDDIYTKWIEIIIDEGHMNSIVWLINSFDGDLSKYTTQGPQLPIVHSVLQRDYLDKHIILKMVLDAGADPHSRGYNDYTPAHYAAINNDVRSLVILLESGANFGIRTRIDDQLTPLEEAELMVGDNDAIKYLRQLDIKPRPNEYFDQ